MEESSKDKAVRIFNRLFVAGNIFHREIIRGVEIVLDCVLCANPSREEAIRKAESYIINRCKGAYAYKFGQACGWLARILKSEGIGPFFEAVTVLFDAVGIKDKPSVHFVGALRLINWFRIGVVNDEEVLEGVRAVETALGNFLVDTAGEDMDPGVVAVILAQYRRGIALRARDILDRHLSGDILRDQSGDFAIALVHLFEAGIEASWTTELTPLVKWILGATQTEKSPQKQDREWNMWQLPTDAEFGKVVIARDPLHPDVLVITTANHHEYRVTVSAITRTEVTK